MVNDSLIHKPVLLSEILYYLNADQEGFYVDATFGAGGYSQAILESNKNNKLLAIDRDPNIYDITKKFKEKYNERFFFASSRFAKLAECLKEIDIKQVDGVVFDLGVSSMQLDNKERGFSFSKKATLDMRMGDNELSAYEIINDFPEEDIADIIFKYGEESYARKIAKYICHQRDISPIENTTDLADIISKAKPVFNHKTKIHPATKTFQAIRIFVNKELEELEIALETTKKLLKKGGRLVVVSFHGLEDKIVKNFIKKNSGMQGQANRYLPINNTGAKSFDIVTKKIVKAKPLEIEENPRSRSAILRAVSRV